MDDKTIKKFRGLTKRSSFYMIFDGVNNIQNRIKPRLNTQNIKPKFPQKKLNLSHSLSMSDSNSSLLKIKNSINKESISEIENSESKNSLYSNEINSFRNTTYNGHRYIKNKLPVLTNSEILLKEMKNMNLKDSYYKRLVSETNFGQKYSIHNPAYEEFSKYNREENLIKLGLNNEEKNPFDLMDKKSKKNYSNLNRNSYNAGFENFEYKLFKKNKHDYKSKDIKKLTKSIKNNIMLSPYKGLKEYPIIKKNEFADYLIMEFIKKNYPSILKNKEKFANLSNNIINKEKNNKKRNILKYLGKNLEARNIYVIKDSTVISNPRFIPGVLVEIPTINGLKKFKKKHKFDLIKRFLDFINIKLRPQLNFNFIFDKNGNLILDFSNLPEKESYIFVSPINLFQGISFSLHKGVIELYLKRFGGGKENDYFFDESSFDETSKIFNKNKFHNDYDENDDVYDLFFFEKFSW